MPKQYAAAENYEVKLARIMNRLDVQEFNYNWDRFSSWIEFRYKGELYRFDHSLENAKTHGVDLKYGSDVFAQLVLSLEDLARMVERGIYDLQRWVAGMKFLPQALEVPSFLKYLGFDEIPSDEEEIKTRYRNLALQMHPDKGGNSEDFMKLKRAAEDALNYYKTKGN